MAKHLKEKSNQKKNEKIESSNLDSKEEKIKQNALNSNSNNNSNNYKNNSRNDRNNRNNSRSNNSSRNKNRNNSRNNNQNKNRNNTTNNNSNNRRNNRNNKNNTNNNERIAKNNINIDENKQNGVRSSRYDIDNKENEQNNVEYNSKKKVKKFSKKSIIKIIFFIIFLLIFIFSIVNLLRWGIYNKKSASLIDDIVENNFNKTDSDSEETSENTGNPVNFEELKNINEDVVAWIRIENTDINYPIVQADDNEYYLTKDINKKYSTCGWIFMNYKNNSDFSDRNTTIFGHNLKSGLMFKDLLKIYKNELGDDVKIEIYTQTEKRVFAVYSSYMIEPEEYATQVLTTEEEQEKYIKEILKRSSVTYNVVPTRSDKLITLSTCDNSGQNRILIHGVYIGGEKY